MHDPAASMTGVHTVEVTVGEAGARLDRWFRRRYPHVTQGWLQKLLRTGQIRVDGGRAQSNLRLEAGQMVRVPPLPETPEARRPGEVSPKDAAFVRSLVVFEDDWLIAINKPAGLAVQGGAKTTRHLDALAPALTAPSEPPRLAHRLDRDTSGLLLLGKTPAATAALAGAFAMHKAQKTYWAITLGVPTPREGQIKGFIKKTAAGGKGGDREVMTTARHGEEGAVYARTNWTVLQAAGPKAAFVALEPDTGRTHQLRFHMSLIGCAIAGDRKYMCDRPPLGGLDPILHLHARSLVLPHPSGRGTLRLTAPPSPHMARAFATLGFDARDVRE